MIAFLLNLLWRLRHPGSVRCEEVGPAIVRAVQERIRRALDFEITVVEEP